MIVILDYVLLANSRGAQMIKCPECGSTSIWEKFEGTLFFLVNSKNKRLDNFDTTTRLEYECRKCTCVFDSQCNEMHKLWEKKGEWK